MRYHLGLGVHFCVVGGQAIFLDVPSDRYTALSARANDAFLRLMSGCEPAKDDEPLLFKLLEKRLLTLCPTGAGLVASDLPAPTNDASGAAESGWSLADGLQVSLIQFWWSRHLRKEGMASTLHRLSRCREKTCVAPLDASVADYGRIQTAFRRTQLLFSDNDRCLPKSIAFVVACYRAGLVPTLVLGVRNRPFAAHCWVQSGDVVLNDTIERVRLFTPIHAQ